MAFSLYGLVILPLVLMFFGWLFRRCFSKRIATLSLWLAPLVVFPAYLFVCSQHPEGLNLLFGFASAAIIGLFYYVYIFFLTVFGPPPNPRDQY